MEQGEWFYTSGDDRIFPQGLAGGRSDRGPSRENAQGDLRYAQRISEWPGRSADRDRRGACSRFRSCRRANQPVHLLAPPPAEPGDARRLRTAATGPAIRCGPGGGAVPARSAKRKSMFTASAARARRITTAAAITKLREHASRTPRRPMNEFSRGSSPSRARKTAFRSSTSPSMIGIPLAAILFQVYVPQVRHVSFLSGIAAAGDGVFLADAAVAGRGRIVRRRHRPGAGFAVDRIRWGCSAS